MALFYPVHLSVRRLVSQLKAIIHAVDLQEGAAAQVKMVSSHTVLEALIRGASNQITIITRMSSKIVIILEYKVYN